MELEPVVADTKSQERPVNTARELAAQITDAAWNKKAMGLVVLDLRGLVSFTDYFVICSGNSDRQVLAIADAIEETLLLSGEQPIGIEGRQDGRWVLMDYGDVVVHIFTEPERDVYALESIWSDASTVRLETPPGLERPSRYFTQ